MGDGTQIHHRDDIESSGKGTQLTATTTLLRLIQVPTPFAKKQMPILGRLLQPEIS